jgi:hypothetical protein
MSQLLTAQSVDMPNFMRLLTMISPEYTVCVRGRHAIGKSEGVYQAAQQMRSDFYKVPENCAAMVAALGGQIKVPKSEKAPTGYVSQWSYEMGVPVLERRLSQMTEGDIIGLPFKHGHDTFSDTGARVTSSSTQFKPCDWLIASCEFPVLLFLDERNRALEGVKQAVFQLTDSKAFYGHNLHQETRIVVAENDGDEYQVQTCDPAEVSRCATVTLVPSVKDWLDYAQGRCHEATIEFIRTNDSLLEHRGNHEPNKKYPDRRSWFKLDSELQRLGLFDNPSDHLFHIMSGAFLGVEACSKFHRFVSERNREVTAEDILTNWDKAKKRLAGKNTITNEQYVEASTKLNSFLNKKDANLEMELEQAEQYAKFMRDAPAEVMMTAWSHLHAQPNNLIKVHKFVAEMLLAVATDAGDQASFKIPTAQEVRAGMNPTGTKTETSEDSEDSEEKEETDKPKAKRGSKTKSK